jgi:uncharacterized membrane protein
MRVAYQARTKTVVRVLLAIAMMGIGVDHFLTPNAFVSIVPAWLPNPRALVLVSGAFEILGGAGLLVPRARRAAGLGLVLLYISVFPANINMAVHDIQPASHPIPVWLLWARLPLQFVFIALAIWCGEIRRKSIRESPRI